MQEELRHQIAAVIDPSLAVSVEPVTAEDIAAAAAYAEQRKAVKVVGGEFVDGAELPTDHLFYNWVNAGGLEVPGAELPGFILGLVNQFNNRSGINQKGG